MRSTDEAIQWYRTHETTAQLGYNPDGMCLKICREARGITAVYPSAVAAQEATPAEHRITDITKIKRGMVMYFDDPRDSNPYGHVVTVVGRVKGSKRSDMHGILVRTNSVKRGRVVVVRADYFKKYWGDDFQFAATWLNGQELEGFEASKSKPKKPLGEKPPRLLHAIKDLEAAIVTHKKRGNTRLVKALERDIAEIRQTIEKFS